MRRYGIVKAAWYLLLCVFAAAVLIPLAWVILAAFKENRAFYGNPWALPDTLTLENVVSAWKNAHMGEYFFNSVAVTVLSLVLLLLLAVPAAYALSRFSFRGRKLIRGVLMAGLFINVSYIVVPIFLMLSDMQRFSGLALLNNRAVVSVVYAVTALSFTVYLLSGFFESLSHSYEEAAMIDGCGYGGTLYRVILPMSRPAVLTAVLFQFLNFWNEYIIAVTLLTDTTVKTLPLGLMNLMKAQNAAAQYGTLYAGMVLAMLPTLVLYLFVQKRLTEGMQLGGLKG